MSRPRGSLRLRETDFLPVLSMNLLVRDLLPDHATDNRRDFWKGELNRTEKWIGLTELEPRYTDPN
jgi:hypothetical protein